VDAFLLFIQVFIGGVAVGGAYTLIALAMVIIYRMSEVLNFAQGDMAAIAVFFAWTLLAAQGLPFYLGLPLAVGFGILVGLAAEFFFLRRAKEPNVLGLIIITLGVEMILFGMTSWKWGADPKNLPFFFSPFDSFVFGSVIVSYLEALTFLTAMTVAALLFLFFRFTKTGAAMKAVQQNRDMARIVGVRTRRILLLGWGLSGGIGALAGLLIAPTGAVDPYLMWDPMLKGFAAAVLGGMTSLPGAVVGGLIMGVVENLFGFYVSTEFKSVVPFAIIVLVLCVKPSGLLARHYVRKV
jgi:branched-chain amino acid transport system permease protein